VNQRRLKAKLVEMRQALTAPAPRMVQPSEASAPAAAPASAPER
jgi:hypothetical protein